MADHYGDAEVIFVRFACLILLSMPPFDAKLANQLVTGTIQILATRCRPNLLRHQVLRFRVRDHNKGGR